MSSVVPLSPTDTVTGAKSLSALAQETRSHLPWRSSTQLHPRKHWEEVSCAWMMNTAMTSREQIMSIVREKIPRVEDYIRAQDTPSGADERSLLNLIPWRTGAQDKWRLILWRHARLTLDGRWQELWPTSWFLISQPLRSCT